MTSLNPVFVVGDQISEVIRLHENLDKHNAAVKAMKMLEMVGIPAERYGEYPHQFSGGMKQSGWSSPRRWPATRKCSSPTSHTTALDDHSAQVLT